MRHARALRRPVLAAVILAASLMASSPHSDPAQRAPTAHHQETGLTIEFPLRPHTARTGSEFVRYAAGLDSEQRRQAIHDELLSGNLPDFLRQLKPVDLSWTDRRGAKHQATIHVTPDYLAVGTDEDFVRMPMGLYTAVSVARRLGCVLPTRKMVDAIYRQADIRLTPRPMRPGPRMSSVDYLWRHNQMIEAQLAGVPLGQLAAGDKKDLVLSNRLLKKARRVAIYGWHRDEDSPIQPLSTVHAGRYADYSHGVRLVYATAEVDGESRSVFDVLEDPRLAKLLSYEGVMPAARQVMSLPFNAPAAKGADPS